MNKKGLSLVLAALFMLNLAACSGGGDSAEVMALREEIALLREEVAAQEFNTEETAAPELSLTQLSAQLPEKPKLTPRGSTLAVSEGSVIGVRADGTVARSGSSSAGDVSGWTDIAYIAARYRHTVGLKTDGTVVAVGENEYGQCNVSDWTDIVAVSAGMSHTVGLKSDGSLVAVGRTTFGQCDVSGWSDIIAIEAGTQYTVGLKSDGTVVAAGKNDDGQCNVSGWSGITAIAAGQDCTLGLKSDGTVVAAGSNADGQCDISDWSGVVGISVGSSHAVGLKSDGTVLAAGDNSFARCNVSDWRDIVAIEAGIYNTVGLKSDGTVILTRRDIPVADWSSIKLPDVILTKSPEQPTSGDGWEQGSEEYERAMAEQAALDAQIDAEERAKITYYEDFPIVPDFGSVTGFGLLKSYERLEGSPQYGGVIYQYEPGTGYSTWEEELLIAGFEVLQSTDSAKLLGNVNAGEYWTTYVLYQNFNDYQRIIINEAGRSTLEEFIRQAEAENNTQQSGGNSGTSGSSEGSSGSSGFDYDYDTDIEMDYGTDWYNPYEDDYQSDSDYDSGTDTWWDDNSWDYNPYGSSDSYDDNHYDADGDDDGWGW